MQSASFSSLKLTQLPQLGSGARASMLPVLILALIALLVIPIPAGMLDMFFILNIAVSLLVLMVALGAAKPLDFSSFPTVILFATLLRLALNVASTRVVLVAGHEGPQAAGKVIEAFGAFLISGDYIVGLFVFAILVIINLVVIAKGAGRISEVSARFTLDALPGKQMAIDADLAAGLLTAEEAKARRQEISTEADFYGSMDGASKFVKGDAIAALLVLFINIGGGLILGTVKHDLPIGEAAATYITLAIGDGLVAQVPSLLLSIAAAAIVTRVNSGSALEGQLTKEFSNAAAWIPVAAIVFLLALLPGMPHFLLLGFAGGCGYVAWRLMRKTDIPAELEPMPQAKPETQEASWEDVVDNGQLRVDIGFGLIDLVSDAKGAPLVGRISGIRKQLSKRFGFLVPRVHIRDDVELSAGDYRISVGTQTLGRFSLEPGRYLAIEPGELYEKLPGPTVIEPAFGLPALWIGPEDKERAELAGYTVVDASTVLATHLSDLLADRMHLLFGQDEAGELVERLADDAPLLAKALTPDTVSMQMLTGVLRRLLEEGVGLGDFRRIAETICADANGGDSAAILSERVRRSLAPILVQDVAPIGETLGVVTLEGELERLLITPDPVADLDRLNVEPGLAQDIIAAMTKTAEDLATAERTFALVTAPRLRRGLFLLLKHHIPGLTVLSFDEVPDDKPVEILGVVGAGQKLEEAA
ncbi:flagellar biosynthesis protein FlhA [Pacificimonas sp. WHA3]|uniref:Flagellar biosynthesis protein FlhA n=1 Tax=Pacificimonas pallii TaxID=2827236 RepID=A0ABS6SF23_9SPHN|nr:flagellar biosynthesis protein FlhA [Pacificimonas pallii]MBV7257007.1 flagellar biosynthesis protein FlhA [Pacificimonas pallii]